jgi:hypothetical protein
LLDHFGDGQARHRRSLGSTRGQRQRSGTLVGNIIDALSSGRHLDIEGLLVLGGDPAGLLNQVPSCASVWAADMGQDRSLTSMFPHDLHRDRTRGGAHLPHVRHRPNLPA